MDGHFEELNMSETQTQWFCRGLVDLANADGMHETELEVIEEFCRSSQLKDVNIDALGTMGFDASDAAAVLTGEARDAFFTTCFILAYADGQMSDIESERLSTYATAFGYDGAQFEQAHVHARVFLISSIAAEIKNHTLLAEIGRSFGLNDEQIQFALSGGE
jgi:tellurite resistance protein